MRLIDGCIRILCMGVSISQVCSANASGSSGEVTARFTWPDRAQARVVEQYAKGTSTLEFAYTLAISKAADASVQIEFRDFDVTRYNGADAHASENQKLLSAALPMLAVRPTLHVSASGEFQDIASTDSMTETTLAFLSRPGRKVSEEDKAAFRRRAATPAFQNAITQSFAGVWAVWVEMWIGQLPRAGEKLKYTARIPYGKKVIEAPMSESNLGVDGEDAHVVRLHIETIEQGEAVTSAVSEYMQTLTADSAEPMGTDAIGAYSRASSYEVLTDPATLQPRFARSKRVTVITAQGTTQRDTEIHEYRFTWQSDPRLEQR